MADNVSSLRIVPFRSHHHGESFDCGVHASNKYLMQLSDQPDQQNITRMFTAINEDNFTLGFYCISATNIEFKNLPEKVIEQLPDYPVSSARIDHLAVDKSIQGNGLGARLLVDALQRIYQAAEEMGIMIVLVHAHNEKSRAFYLHYGFLPLSGEESKLFLPMDRVAWLFDQAEIMH